MRAAFACAAVFAAVVVVHSRAGAQVPGAGAQTPDTAERAPTTVDSVVVRGRRTSEIVPAQLLGGEALRRLSSHSVADAVRYFSGVQVKDYGGIGGLKTVNVRSLGSAHTGVFYDGVQVSSAQNGAVDLGRFSLEGVETVALYYGQKSDVFQPARDFASASALYISSRTPRFDDGQRTNFRATARTGSFDLASAAAAWEQLLPRRPGRRLSASADTEFVSTSGRYKYRYTAPGWDTTAVRRNGDVRYMRAEAGLFGQLPGGEWRVKGYFYGSERGYPGAVIKEDAAIAMRNEDRQRDRSWFVQSSVVQQLSPLYSYRVQAKFADDRTDYVMPPGTTLMPQDTHYKARELYLSMSNLFAATRALSVGLSADGQFNSLDAQDDASNLFNQNFPRPRRLTLMSAAAVSARFGGNGGSLSLRGSLLHTFTHESSARGRAVARDRSIFTPTLVAAWRPWRHADFEARAFYKRIFRLPTFNDLYYTQLGNRSLRPEFTTQYNVGVRWRGVWERGPVAALELSIDAYYNEVRDKIVATPTSNQLVWTMLNLGFVEIRGLDAAVAPQFRIGRATLSTRLTYTFQRAQDFSPERRPEPDTPDTVRSNWGDQIPYIPRHSSSAVAGAVWGRGGEWSANYSVVRTGERWGLGDNVPANRLAPWVTHDLSASRDIQLKESVLRIGAEVNNIFGQRYEVVSRYPMPGVNFRLTVSITI